MHQCSQGLSAPPRRNGFTLIELLVVLFLVAVLAGLAVMQLGDRAEQRELQREAQRLQHLIELGRQEALRSASQWGVRFDDGEYRFLQLDPERRRWQPVDSGPWSTRTLPPTMQIRVRSEGGTMLRRLDGDGEARERPAIVLLSSGETSPFELRLHDSRLETGWLLTSDGYQRTQLEPGQTGPR